jgi:transglutaminase-like putative cysteine protease
MTHVALERPEIKVGEGASTFLLLAVLLLSVTGSIDAANWTDGLSLLTWAVLGGLSLGFILAKLAVRASIAHALMLALTLPATATLASFQLPGALTFFEKIRVLQERTQVWFAKVAAGKEGSDALIFVIQLCIVMWIIGYVAAWFVYRRHQVWGAILPAGFALIINLFYALQQSGFYLIIFLLCALLLLVRMNLHALEQWWRGAAIGYASDISFDFLLYGTLFAILLVMLAWLVPASAPGPSWLSILEPLQEPWQGVEDQFTRVFNTLRAVARPSSTAFIGTTLTMGGPVHLGQQPVMDIQADAGRYWRGAVYDKYTGAGWISTHLDSLNLDANDPRLDRSAGWMRTEVTQTVKLYIADQNILFGEAQPIRFDLPTEIRYAQSPQPASGSAIFDLTLVRARRPIREGTVYHVASLISLADEDSLRADSAPYPSWIAAAYLQLPAELPERVRDLAATITASASNPYDKAAAIEEYLRTHIKYNENVSAPPPNRDGVDYTLFDRPEGYCNYYASAMAVMLRAIGIPARVASGYTLGNYKDGVYHIVEANAHSWPEVYFPSYGWIEFEPTANKPEIERPKKPDRTTQNPDLTDPAAEARRQRQHEKDLEGAGIETGPAAFLPFGSAFWNNPASVALAGGGLIVLMLLGALTVRRWQHTRRIGRLAPAARVYEDMLSRARWLGVREEKHATPLERARAIGAAAPEARREVERVASLYAREKFGAQTMDAADRAALADAWSKFSAAWWRALFTRIVDRTITPLHQFIERARIRLAHWNIPNE